MSIKSTTNIKVILYTSKTLANGDHPLMLRLTKEKKRKYLSLGISCALKYWNIQKQLPKKTHPDKDLIENIIAQKISDYKSKVLEFKKDKKDFSLDSLIQLVEKPNKRSSVYQFFDEVFDRLEMSNMVGNANAYKDAKRALFKFCDNRNLLFSEIDYSFLIKYEAHLRGNNMSDNGISVYFRTLRSLFNKAIKENVANSNDYPFNVFKISKFNNETQRRAITKENIKAIESLEIDEGSFKNEARQYFLFSYYGMGINFKDIAFLKWENIVGDRIYYKRTKTRKEINFKISAPIKTILNPWEPITKFKSDNYIFPILNDKIHITDRQQDNRIHKILTKVNKELKEIGKEANIDIPLTTYVARHTFATTLKKSGVNTAIISEALGHRNQEITEIYLKSFENEVLDNAMENLL